MKKGKTVQKARPANQIQQPTSAIANSRRPCLCMARVHNLVNNCVNCGRIICEQEGEGPCLFCGNPVYSSKSEQMLAEDEEMQAKFEQDFDYLESYLKAVDNKEKLLNYERESIASKNIIDQETDWYEIKNDVWQSDKARKQATHKIHEEARLEQEAKSKIVYDVNIATGEVMGKESFVDYGATKKEAQQYLKQEEDAMKRKSNLQVEANKIDDEKMREVLSGLNFSHAEKMKKKDDGHGKQKHEVAVKNLAKVIQHDDVYDKFLDFHKQYKSLEVQENTNVDEDLYDLSKTFNHKCLSMWQPWASLVISGIMRFEGRTWNTSYRGPLWIQAGARPTDSDDVKKCEKLYSEIYKDYNLPSFPKTFPEKMIIGVVDLQDVWTQEEYKQRIKTPFNQESNSPFVFVFRNPRKLLVPIKHAGQQQIFDLPNEVVKPAIHSLVKVHTSFAPYFAKSYFTTDNQAIQAQQQFDLFDSKLKLKQESKPSRFSLFTVSEDICLSYIQRTELSLKKSLKVGYENRKTFAPDEMADADILFEIMKVAAKKYGAIHLSTIIDQKAFTIDVFRLNSKSLKFNFEKDYKFFVNFGDSIMVTLADQKTKALLNENELLMVEDIPALGVEQLVSARLKTTLNPIDDYTVVVIGFYLSRNN